METHPKDMRCPGTQHPICISPTCSYGFGCCWYVWWHSVSCLNLAYDIFCKCWHIDVIQKRDELGQRGGNNPEIGPMDYSCIYIYINAHAPWTKSPPPNEFKGELPWQGSKKRGLHVCGRWLEQEVTGRKHTFRGVEEDDIGTRVRFAGFQRLGWMVLGVGCSSQDRCIFF